MDIKIIKEVLEKRIGSLVIDKHQTDYYNGQVWARKDELSNLLAHIKKIEKLESQK